MKRDCPSLFQSALIFILLTLSLSFIAGGITFQHFRMYLDIGSCWEPVVGQFAFNTHTQHANEIRKNNKRKTFKNQMFFTLFLKPRPLEYELEMHQKSVNIDQKQSKPQSHISLILYRFLIDFEAQVGSKIDKQSIKHL